MKKKQKFPLEKGTPQFERESAVWQQHLDELFDEMCECLGEDLTRKRWAHTLAKADRFMSEQRNLGKSEPFDWRKFKATDYVARETDDEPKRSRTSLKAR